VPALLASGGVVEAFYYATSPPDGSPFRARIERDAEHFRCVADWPAGAVADAVAGDGCHIAVNLNGYTKGARGDVFALAPAPVAVSYMGFPATLADPAIQWLISDAVASPPAAAPFYGEAVARMPGCYFVNDYRATYGGGVGQGGGGGKDGVGRDADACDPPAALRAALGLPPPPTIVFGCANQVYKIDPPTLDAWAAILRAVPDSVLWLLRFPPAAEPRLRAEAAARGLPPSRLVFTDVAPRDAHVARAAAADLYLDTPTVNAHTTACDVLWAGAPILTLPRATMASRVCASLVTAAGEAGDLVAAGWEDYVRRAVALARDRPRLAALRARLRAGRASARLWDTAGWVRAFEGTLVAVWARSVAGRVASFDVDDVE
jgi:protein O-GlcNAc transferase